MSVKCSKTKRNKTRFAWTSGYLTGGQSFQRWVEGIISYSNILKKESLQKRRQYLYASEKKNSALLRFKLLDSDSKHL